MAAGSVGDGRPSATSVAAKGVVDEETVDVILEPSGRPRTSPGSGPG